MVESKSKRAWQFVTWSDQQLCILNQSAPLCMYSACCIMVLLKSLSFGLYWEDSSPAPDCLHGMSSHDAAALREAGPRAAARMSWQQQQRQSAPAAALLRPWSVLSGPCPQRSWEPCAAALSQAANLAQNAIKMLAQERILVEARAQQSVASMDSPIWIVPTEKLEAVCSMPVKGSKPCSEWHLNADAERILAEARPQQSVASMVSPI